MRVYLVMLLMFVSCVNSSDVALEEFTINEIHSTHIKVRNNCGEIFTIPPAILNMSEEDMWKAFIKQASILLYRDKDYIYAGY